MSHKNWRLYALHILDCIEKIELIQQRGSIVDDTVLYDATLRNLQTLSESTQRLPDELKNQFLEIPWKQISGFRNILVHEYLGTIDVATVNSIITSNLPALKSTITAMLSTHVEG